MLRFFDGNCAYCGTTLGLDGMQTMSFRWTVAGRIILATAFLPARNVTNTKNRKRIGSHF